MIRTFILLVGVSLWSFGEGVKPLPAPGQPAMRVVPPTENGFQIKLSIEGGHIRELFLGCAQGRSDQFDRREPKQGAGKFYDEMAPPPGIGTGYTFLVSPDRTMSLYKDYRGLDSAEPQWVLFAKRGREKPVSVSWEPAQIPDGKRLFCAKWDGTSEKVSDVVDCRKVRTVTHPGTTYYRFWLVEAEPEPAAAK